MAQVPSNVSSENMKGPFQTTFLQGDVSTIDFDFDMLAVFAPYLAPYLIYYGYCCFIIGSLYAFFGIRFFPYLHGTICGFFGFFLPFLMALIMT